MENRIKDLILFGLGSALMTREKIESLVDEFARHGKMSREEARSFVDETIAKGNPKASNWKPDFGRSSRMWCTNWTWLPGRIWKSSAMNSPGKSKLPGVSMCGYAFFVTVC